MRRAVEHTEHTEHADYEECNRVPQSALEYMDYSGVCVVRGERETPGSTTEYPGVSVSTVEYTDFMENADHMDHVDYTDHSG